MNTAAKSVRSYCSLTSRTVYPILLMVSITHLLNDMMQSVIPAVYPLLKEKFDFTFAQIGLITLVFQLTSSLLQPVAGLLADRHPRPYSLAGGMCFTLAGLLVLAFAPGFVWILIAVGLIGCGSSVFHPPRVWRNLLRAAARDWHSRSSRWAEMPEALWGPCWPR